MAAEQPATPAQYFDFFLVEPTDPTWIAVQRLRYDVYCEELGFFDPANYPNRRESDEFDAFAIQIAAVDRDKQAVATVRLVRDSHLGFPLERQAPVLYSAFRSLPRERTVEISRLILAKTYRRRAGDSRYGTELMGHDRRRVPRPGPQRRSPYPLILFGLFRIVFETSVQRGLQWWVAAMEPWLQKFLEHFGFVFTPIGDPFDYHGDVVPYAARIEDIFKTVSEMKPEVLQMVLGERRSRPGRAQ
jgi:N-acyl amino acid synthase of PEP-CTERM/exosortase system